MNIGYLLDDNLDVTDGVQQCVLALGEEMRRRGHDVHYLVADTKRADIKNIWSIASTVSLKFNSNSVRTPKPVSRAKISKVLDFLDLDVLHVQLPFSPFFGSKVIKLVDKNTKIVGTWHTFPSSKLGRLSHHLLNGAIKESLKKFSVTIGVSQPTAEFADSIYNTQSIVIPNAVNISRYQLAPTKASSKKKLVYLGRFDERKGPVYLIKALGRLKLDGYDMKKLDIIMGGKGPDLKKCQSLATKFGLKISFPGFILEADKPSLLGSADLTIFPSTGGEAFGISVVEAMASGASVVLAGDNPGYRSILGEKSELLFEPKDTSAFSEKIRKFVNMSKSEALKYKSWLRNSAKQYDVVNVCDQLENIYQS